MRNSKPILSLALLSLLLSPAVTAGLRQLLIELPGKPKVDFVKGDSILIAPFLMVTPEKDTEDKNRRKAEDELRNFFSKMLSKGQAYNVQLSEGVPLASTNVEKLKNAAAYWKTLASQYSAKFVISGVLDFTIKDQSGYETEEYTSPYNGRTYYRQVLVEKSGVSLELLLWVFNGADGAVATEENFKHFLEKKGKSQDFVTAFFEGVHAFESGLEAVFLSKPLPQKRNFYAF
jgi:hypothetical protein